MTSFAVTFARTRGEIACQYYEFLRLGREGYARVKPACYVSAQVLAPAIVVLGPIEIIAGADGRDLAMRLEVAWRSFSSCIFFLT